MHMNSECSLTSRFSSGIIRCLSAPESRQSSPGFPELKAIASRIGAACWLHASETESLWGWACCSLGICDIATVVNNTSPVLQDKTGAVLPLNQDENVQHSTDSGERIYCLQIKKIILLCLTWIGMRQPHPFLPLSLLLAPSVTYSEECSTALYSANAELQLFLTVELRFYTHTHTRTERFSLYMAAEIWHSSGFRWLILLYFLRKEIQKKEIF